jgi:hypothetical protein
MWKHFCRFFCEGKYTKEKSINEKCKNENDHQCTMNKIIRRRRMKVFVALSNGHGFAIKQEEHTYSPRSVVG